MSHLVNESGYPVEPELFRMESRLSQLAAGWRGARNDPERQTEFVREYHITMAQLILQGWDVRLAGLDPEDTLPDSLMPETPAASTNIRANRGRHIALRQNPFSKESHTWQTHALSASGSTMSSPTHEQSL